MMDESDILIEENKPAQNVFQPKEKWVLVVVISLILFIIFLHFFGDWSISRSESIFNGDETTRELKYTYENRCLLFNQSHIGEVLESDNTSKKKSNGLLWVILNSFSFTFTGHIITWLIILGALFILYWFAGSNKK